MKYNLKQIRLLEFAVSFVLMLCFLAVTKLKKHEFVLGNLFVLLWAFFLYNEAKVVRFV